MTMMLGFALNQDVFSLRIRYSVASIWFISWLSCVTCKEDENQYQSPILHNLLAGTLTDILGVKQRQKMQMLRGKNVTKLYLQSLLVGT